MRLSLISPFCWLMVVFSTVSQPAAANEVERLFIESGLVDVQAVDPSLQVDLVNSDPDKNYFRENFYKGLSKAYLQKEVALKLKKAQKILKARHAEYSLLVLDAARPRSVSKRMYDKMKGTKFEKYVANPTRGSMHNYGIAVDITIVDKRGEQLDMGFTPFHKSNLEIYWQMIRIKLGSDLSKEQLANRKLLSETMRSAGFKPLSYEWWHFNGIPKDVARQKYAIIE